MTTTPRTNPQDRLDTEIPPRPFVDVLKETGKGTAHRDASHLLREVVAAVTDTRKPGTVTVTVKVEVPKKGDFLLVSAEAKAKVPELDAEASFWFVDGAGNLTRHDPNQLSLLGEDAKPT